MKPFTLPRLLAAVNRARRHLQARDTATLHQQLAEWLKSSASEPVYLSRIAVKSGNQTVFIKVEDLDYIESAANYAVLEARGERHVLRETITNLEAKLPPRSFVRISHSIIVNLDRVKAVQSSLRGEYTVLLQDGRQLPMTRGAQEIQQKLQYPVGQSNDSQP